MTADRIVVGIPTATEPIHHMGDVTEPKHMTLCKLGSPEENPDLDIDAIHDAVRGVAESYDAPVTAPVASQGPLGDDGAQVVFLGGDEVSNLHDSLLAAPELREGTGAVQQHPEFIPHVTLGYELEEPVADEDLPDQVIFDRLGVWDGEEHTEFPLGPSATSEEETADPFEQEMVAAMMKPIAVYDASSLAEAIELCGEACGTAQTATRPILMKRARELGCQHLIPTSWLRQRALSAAARNVTEVAAQNGIDVPDLFRLKTQLSTLSDTALRSAYMRGVREFTMTAPQSRPPLPRDVVAQARVNSLIRLAQGDLSARTDDRDLLP
jgi:2'-5' RNA ligase